MAFSSLFISDSQTMSAEAAVLGVPNIRFSDDVGRLGYLNELENKYELSVGISPDNTYALFSKVERWIGKLDKITEKFRARRVQMLRDKIDVTAFFVWFLDNFPESKKIMLENPDYQNRFK